MTAEEAIAWLEAHDGAQLCSDDAGRWAVSLSGHASVEDEREAGRFITDGPINWAGTAWVERGEWRDSIIAAVEAAKDKDE